jgi:hypothetical protein
MRNIKDLRTLIRLDLIQNIGLNQELGLDLILDEKKKNKKLMKEIRKGGDFIYYDIFEEMVARGRKKRT